MARTRLARSLFPAVLAMGVAAGQPAITNVANAASNVVQGLPNSGIAQGSIFIVQGTNLGPTSITFAQTPFQSPSLDGVGISVTVGSTTVNPLMYYASAAQLAALLPSNTPAGSGTMTVTYQGSPSATFAVQVVPNNIGIFSLSQDGQGIAVATYPDYSLVSAVPGTGALGGGGPDTYAGAPHPGDVVTLWTTGLGPVNGGDGTSSLGQTSSVAMTLWIGGVSVPITYQGRSGCCIGEDQIVFTMPSGAASGQPGTVPGGCAVPVVLQIGNLLSNTTVMPVASTGRSCTPSSPALNSSAIQALTTGTGPITFGAAQLGRELVAANSSGIQYEDIAQVSFGQISETYGDAVQNSQPVVLSSFDVPPLGACLAYNSTLNGNPPLITYVAGADAGTVAVGGPNGQIPLVNHGGTPTVYGSIVSGLATYYSGGAYTVTGGGGNAIGKFTIHFNIAQSPIWPGADQNRLETATIQRASGMTINWTSGSPAYNLLISGTSYTDGTGTIGASFTCLVPSAPGTFTVPEIALLALPAGPYTEVDFKPILPPQSFTADGLGLGIMNFAYQTTVLGVQFQ